MHEFSCKRGAKMKTCCFAGHSNILNKDEVKIKLKKKIINLIEKENATTFYSGDKGDFDLLCAKTLKEFKNYYPYIKSYLILSYIPKEKDAYKSLLYSEIFDESIYPDIEKTPPRFAIVKRNEWMINNSDFLIAYVEHNWGGAAKTLEYAKKKKHIKTINIAQN